MFNRLTKQVATTMPVKHTRTKIGEAYILREVDVSLQLSDVQQSLGRLKDQASVIDSLLVALEKAGKVWQPASVYRWFACYHKKGETELSCQATGENVRINLSHSCDYLRSAERVLVGVYTVGREIERVAAELASQGKIFDSYLYESIALAVLRKFQKFVCEICELEALSRGWGVGPFLSPGSVNGWDLVEQIKICPLLPLAAIDVEMDEKGILNPFKSVSFLVGIGREYTDHRVGSACKVCSMKDSCSVRRMRSTNG